MIGRHKAKKIRAGSREEEMKGDDVKDDWKTEGKEERMQEAGRQE
jgi:hypothetical protein